MCDFSGNASDACLAIQRVVNGSFSFPFRDFEVPDRTRERSIGIRFGHISDFENLFGSKNDQQDYIYGLIWLGGLMAGVFIVWSIVIVIFLLMGSNRVGFLSGAPFNESSSSSISSSSILSSSSSNNNQEGTSPTGTKTTAATNENETEQKNETPIEHQENTNVTTESLNPYFSDIDEQQQQPIVIRGTAALSDDGDSDDQIVNVQNVINELSNLEDSRFPTNMTEQLDADKSTINSKDELIDDNQTSNIDNLSRNKVDRHSNRKRCMNSPSIWIRRIFITSGFIVIISAVLLVTIGLPTLQRTVDTLNSSAGTTANLTSNASTVIREDIQPLQQQMVSRILNFSLALAEERICPAGSDSNQSTPLVDELRNQTLLLINQLRILTAQIEVNVTSLIGSPILDAYQTSSNLYKRTNGINMTDWRSIFITSIYVVVSLLLITSAVMASYGRSNKIYQSCMVWIIFPLFVILTVFATIICSVGMISGTANADLCYPIQYNDGDANELLPVSTTTEPQDSVILNSPDATFLLILQTKGYNIDSIDYKVISFYVSQCSAVNPLANFEQYIPIVQQSADAISTFLIRLQDPGTVEELATECGRDYEEWINVGNELNERLTFLSKRLLTLLEMISCPVIVPIYQASLYDAGCDQSLLAIAWMFFTTLFMAFFGFLMITFRSAYSVNNIDTAQCDDPQEIHSRDSDTTDNNINKQADGSGKFQP